MDKALAINPIYYPERVKRLREMYVWSWWCSVFFFFCALAARFVPRSLTEKRCSSTEPRATDSLCA